MKPSLFLKDKIFFIILSSISQILIILLLLVFNSKTSLIIAIEIVLLSLTIISLLFEYFRKNSFYNELLTNIKALDKSYLVIEILNSPNFYEGKIFMEALYEINKSMIENIKIIDSHSKDFKEYIEMWIHEVKAPIASILLMLHNNSSLNCHINEQVKRIEYYVEQVLFYVRSENASKDYLIKEISLSKLISEVALKNKDDILAQKINLEVKNVDYKIFSDSKWLIFILNQIIYNSIKYKKEEVNSYIKIWALEKDNKIILNIKDNGIGIPLTDIKKVFNKTYTGTNGREKNKSTGLGLYIAHNLCKMLGHEIKIESQEDKYTKVTLIFSKNKFYEVVK